MTSEKDFIKNIKSTCKRFKKDGAKLKIASAILTANNDEGTNPILSIIMTNGIRNLYNAKATELAKSINLPYEGITEELGTLFAVVMMTADLIYDPCEKIAKRLLTVYDSQEEVHRQIKNFKEALNNFASQILEEAYGNSQEEE